MDHREALYNSRDFNTEGARKMHLRYLGDFAMVGVGVVVGLVGLKIVLDGNTDGFQEVATGAILTYGFGRMGHRTNTVYHELLDRAGNRQAEIDRLES